MKKILILILLLSGGVFFLGSFDTKASNPYFISPEKSILGRGGSLKSLDEYNKAELPRIASDKTQEPQLSAQSYIVVEKETMAPILKKNEKEKRAIASLTKLMTYKVISEEVGPGDILKITNNESGLPPLISNINVGDEIAFENIARDMLIASSNNATQILSNYFEEKTGAKIVDIMNRRALEIGMANSSFSNVIGLDYAGNYSTAQDLVYLVNSLMGDKFFLDTAKTKEAEIEKSRGTSYKAKTTNILLEENPSVMGIKTGTTPTAGECLALYFKTKNSHEYIAIILGSQDRFGDARKIIEWAEGNLK